MVSKIVEPPVLISKVLTFVLAVSIVVLATLVFTLVKMAPLNRPEIFFLFTPSGHFTNMVIIPMVPDETNERMLDTYKKGFIREYIISRNTLYAGTNIGITRDNWAKTVEPWSSKQVWDDFVKTKLYKQYQFSNKSQSVSCSVNFSNTNNTPAVLDLRNDTYDVNFVWICKDENSGRQTQPKNYKIRVRIQSVLDKQVVKDLEKLRDNPLGIQVVEYSVQNDKGDPLDSI